MCVGISVIGKGCRKLERRWGCLDSRMLGHLNGVLLVASNSVEERVGEG